MHRVICRTYIASLDPPRVNKDFETQSQIHLFYLIICNCSQALMVELNSCNRNHPARKPSNI